MTAPETLQFVTFSFSRHFEAPVVKQPKRFGQNPPGKVLKVMSAYFLQNFSQFDFSVYSLILDPYVQRLLRKSSVLTKTAS